MADQPTVPNGPNKNWVTKVFVVALLAGGIVAGVIDAGLMLNKVDPRIVVWEITVGKVTAFILVWTMIVKLAADDIFDWIEEFRYE